MKILTSNERPLDLISSVKRWNPKGVRYLIYPENVRREFEDVLLSGRWWNWMHPWMHAFCDFAAEVAVVARALGVVPQVLALRLLDLIDSCEESSILCWFDPDSPPVPAWEIGQVIEGWVFYFLRPALRAVVELELDGKVN